MFLLFTVLVYVREAHESVFTALLISIPTIQGLCSAVSLFTVSILNIYSHLYGYDIDVIYINMSVLFFLTFGEKNFYKLYSNI